MLPTFLGIGVPKAGTTWLYDLMAAHPNVYVSAKLKEVHYFDRHFAKGSEWYEGFFPSLRDSPQYAALGEVTPQYLYCQACPQRIAAQLDHPQFILILRNPVKRAWSDYVFKLRIANYRNTFENFLVDFPSALRYGFYLQNIENYLRFFDRDQLLILISEKVFADIKLARKQLAQFLNIDPALFPETAGMKKANQGYVPRFRTLSAFSTRTLELAVRKEQYWLVNLAKRSGLKRLLSLQGSQVQPMRAETRKKLQDIYAQEITGLEALLQVDLSHWRV